VEEVEGEITNSGAIGPSVLELLEGRSPLIEGDNLAVECAACLEGGAATAVTTARNREAKTSLVISLGKEDSMRRTGLVLCCLSFTMYLSLLAQTMGFTLKEYLAPQYLAPANAPSSVVIAGKDEPGERLIVSGRTLDGAKPVPGVSLYVFHADVKGQYAPGMDQWAGEYNPRLHAALRTDEQGRYQYETTRPGSYDNGAAHVHYVVSAPGYEPLLLALQFQDDPIVVEKGLSKPPLDSDAFKNGPCKSRPDCVLTQPVTRDAQGVSHVVRDIQMVKK
jgi:hypothetical protein